MLLRNRYFLSACNKNSNYNNSKKILVSTIRQIFQRHNNKNNNTCLFQSIRYYSVVPIKEEHISTASSTTTTGSDTRHDGHDDDDKMGLVAKKILPYFNTQTPVVLRGAIVHDRAIELWQTWEYFQNIVNEDQMGSVEIGGTYNNTGTDRAEIPFHAYLQYLQMFEERHGRTGSDDIHDIPKDITKEELVYMAQNDLFPTLQKDITIPPFCRSENEGGENVNYKVGLGRLYSVMLWLGPRGCTSPLHFDPLDNCLMQYVGRKKVWLYEPIPGGWSYAGHDGQQSNTSPVNPEQFYNDAGEASREAKKYPLFANEAPTPIECVLYPGDLLYIPSKWWHFVRSIDTSASVNVWWR